MDDQLCRLERLAAQGDEAATEQLWLERARVAPVGKCTNCEFIGPILEVTRPPGADPMDQFAGGWVQYKQPYITSTEPGANCSECRHLLVTAGMGRPHAAHPASDVGACVTCLEQAAPQHTPGGGVCVPGPMTDCPACRCVEQGVLYMFECAIAHAERLGLAWPFGVDESAEGELASDDQGAQ